MFNHPNTGVSGVGQARANIQSIYNNGRNETHLFLSHLEEHLIARYGDEGAALRAQMLFDAFGPGRDIDPKSMFGEDSDGDNWPEL